MTTDTDKAAMEAGLDERYPVIADRDSAVADRAHRYCEREGWTECWKLHVAPRDVEIDRLKAELRGHAITLAACKRELDASYAEVAAMKAAVREYFEAMADVPRDGHIPDLIFRRYEIAKRNLLEMAGKDSNG